VAVLSDALESLINIAAAGMMLYAIWLSNQPADTEHPYGHGKVEFLAVGLEVWLILTAGVLIAYEAIKRLIWPREVLQIGLGIVLLAGVGVLTGLLAWYVLRAGKRYDNATLIADGKHLLTDAISTAAVFLGLLLVRWTQQIRLDPLIAIAVAGLILFMSWRLLGQSVSGLMDRQCPKDDRLIRDLLNEEIRSGAIVGYHKLRHRHNGAFHWVDMHLQMDRTLSIAQGHKHASRIEGRIEQLLGQADATAHLEPDGLAASDHEPGSSHPATR